MEVAFDKNKDGLVPAIIQDPTTKNVLMLGYMNEDALNKTMATGKVTFYSRSKKRIWQKGEESGNFLNLVNVEIDCDHDTLLISANPAGPTCHKGSDTCWNKDNVQNFGFLTRLEAIISDRKENDSNETSYVSSLFKSGINKIAQKVGEEAVETVIEAKDDNEMLFLEESADLLFHYLILLQAKGHLLKDVVDILKSRHKI
jgi:phosphoribosyl-ATP pyrophosphohydrolase/phosphoribosyl-AMP cyclohydrolase